MTDQNTLPPPPNEMLESISGYVTTWSHNQQQARRVPQMIYHYCDANAFLSIFQNRNLWATSTRYLNDSTELVSLMQDLPGHIATLPATPSRAAIEAASKVATGMGAHMLSHGIGMEHFAACFSREGDILNQWHAYADEGRGFAIGFDPSDLAVLQGDAVANGDIRTMLYGPDDASAIAREFLTGFAQRLEPYTDILDSTGWQHSTARTWVSLRLNEVLFDLTFEAKHPSFCAEREVRIYAGAGEIRFRAARNTIIPYRTLDVSSASNPTLMPVRRVILGPKTDKLATERVLMYLFESLGYGHAGIEIGHSAAPYR